ncbi:hypothetical protein ANCCAN_02931 [Ancylostoma caninum]|uniref:Uncharacterized protein n=1 Tax=Ancylostoma caninum TaxID=29170 RepID=A0A368H593_ANCCA|nr:hypothetical protein ANCCAN_02931 [Ancylostoma caninum]
MLSGIKRAALESIAQCRTLSTTSVARTYDPRCIRAEGFDPNKMEDVDPAFSPAGMFIWQSKPYVIQSGGLEFSNSGMRKGRPSNILLDVITQRPTNQMADTLSDHHGGM